MAKKLVLSVHTLVDFLLRSGSIDSRVFNVTAMNEGTRLHAIMQKKARDGGESYLAEFPLQETFEVQNYSITLQGRADGVVQMSDGRYFIDEIKTTVSDLEIFHSENEEWHLGQAKCYALMLAHLYHLEEVGVWLTYSSQVNNQKLNKQYFYKTAELEEYIYDLLERYLSFYNVVAFHQSRRNESAASMRFPFETFREGQKTLAEYTYAITKQGGTLYVEAPTGIGKTISTLYPSVHAFHDQKIEKIFYLTAKTSGQESAYQTLQIMRTGGLIIKPIIITAKDKICLKPGAECNPDECPFAKNYYNKLADVLYEILSNEDNLDYDTIVAYAKKHTICPFELQLDLSLYSDVIIGDYNYLFDPLVYLKRFFDQNGSGYFALIDEAHNLVERTRNMYSANISEQSFKQMKAEIKDLEHEKMKKTIRKLTRETNKFAKSYQDEKEVILEELPPVLFNAFNDFLSVGRDVMRNESAFIDEEFRDFFFAVNRFFKIYDYFDDTYVLYLENTYQGWNINLFNLDPRNNVKRGLNKVYGSVVFSATLSPLDYYIYLLGGNKDSPFLRLQNPFPDENRLLLVAPEVETTYRKRDRSYGLVSDYIEAFVTAKKGNYLVFFPSYKYLESVKVYLDLVSEKYDFTLISQEKNMTTADRNEFLGQFEENPQTTMVGLAVMGGVFAEGIDLADDRLIGAVVVGVGLPTVSFERNLIKEYYDQNELSGFNYAYTNPGMNRVAQALGRVIRSESDRGAVLLLDARFMRSNYREFISGLNSQYQIVNSPEETSAELAKFWHS